MSATHEEKSNIVTTTGKSEQRGGPQRLEVRNTPTKRNKVNERERERERTNIPSTPRKKKVKERDRNRNKT
jgi:hypothetical protein